jgi:hypothetical protein
MQLQASTIIGRNWNRYCDSVCFCIDEYVACARACIRAEAVPKTPWRKALEKAIKSNK